MEFFNSLIQTLTMLMLSLGAWFSIAIGGIDTHLVIKNPLPVAEQAATSTPKAPVATTTATSTKPKTPTTSKKKVAVPVQTTPAPVVPATVSNDVIAEINTSTRASVVNILCSFRTATISSYISGSGLIIDSRGVVLTNAHVAQFLLLQNYMYPGSTSCTIRTGSPATAAYKVTLLYLSPAWIDTNASQIISDQAVGTGERDYAFLYITGPTQFASPLPSSFPSLTYSTEHPKTNDQVLLAGYPAGFLTGTQIERSLYVSSAVSKIGQLYTFNSSANVDLISLGGTAVAQSGSSGGAVINLITNKLVGLIATESEGTTTASRDLRAVTIAHINRSLVEDGKGGVASLLSGNLLQTAQDFNSTVAPALTKKLVDAIEK